MGDMGYNMMVRIWVRVGEIHRKGTRFWSNVAMVVAYSK